MIVFVVLLLWSYFRFEVKKMAPLQSQKIGDTCSGVLLFLLPLFPQIFVCIFSRNTTFVPATSQLNKEQQPFISVFPTLR